MNKKINLILSFLVSIVILAWVLSAVDFNEVLAQLKTVEVFWFIPATIILIVQFILRSLRWQLLVPDRKSMPLMLSFDGIMLSNFVSYVLPLRAGEIARPIFLSRKSDNSFANCFAGIIIERFFDLSLVLILFKIVLAPIENLPVWVNQGANALLVIAIIIFSFIIIAALLPKLAKKIIDLFLKICPKKLHKFFSPLLMGIVEGAQSLRSVPSLVLTIFYSLLVWFVTILAYYIYLHIFDFEVNMYQALVITIILALAVAAPSAPGFIGVFQGACLAAFLLLGLSEEQSLTFSILTHIHMYLITIGYGLFLLFKYNLNFKELKDKNP